MFQFIKNTKYIVAVAVAATALQCAFVSCSDDPGAENYFTTKEEFAGQFLANRPERFSEFLTIIQRAHRETLLNSIGSYTVFAPTNAAVDEYLAARGLQSVDQLSTEDCDTITNNHIIEQAYFTTDFCEGTYPTANMLERFLTVTTDSDTLSVPGEVRLDIRVNRNARIVQMDDSVGNGVVHTLSSVIGLQNNKVADVIAEDSTATLFYAALMVTGIDQQLTKYKDENYTIGYDSIDWSNDALCVHTAVEYDNVAYMEHRYFKYTCFVPQDQVLKDKYGVESVEDLKALAASLYDPCYPDDANVTDPKDPRNSFHRFILYHILPFQALYYNITEVDGPNSTLANGFNRRKWDISDWYQTMLPFGSMKFSYPSGSEAGLYINRRGVMSRPDVRGYKTRGARVLPASDHVGLNGLYHYIDDVVSYGLVPDASLVDKETHRQDADASLRTQDYVFSERMRLDCSTLSPDFMTAGARGHYTRSSIENGKYGKGGQGAKAATNVNTCLGFKPGAAIDWDYDAKTHVHVRNRILHFWSYGGDEVTVKGRFNIRLTLPCVPAGDWELRFGTALGFDSRGIVQFYIDDDGDGLNEKPQGIPIDLRPGSEDPKIGWKSDASLGDEEQIAAFDKQFRYRGWMKGPACYSGQSEGGGNVSGTSFRGQNNTVRKIIGTFHSDGVHRCVLRLEQKMESDNNEMNFDFVEMCPRSVYDNPDVAEDRW